MVTEIENTSKPLPIIGYYGCYCHPFETLKEYKDSLKQKIAVGDIIQHRCTKKIGVIHREWKETYYNKQDEPYEVTSKVWFNIKYGEKKSDEQNIHMQECIKISKENAPKHILKMANQIEIKSKINAALARLEQLKNSKIHNEAEKTPLINHINKELENLTNQLEVTHEEV